MLANSIFIAGSFKIFALPPCMDEHVANVILYSEKSIVMLRYVLDDPIIELVPVDSTDS